MLLNLKHIESEQGKQTIIINVCHCVKTCSTAVNVGLDIPLLPLKSILIIYQMRDLVQEHSTRSHGKRLTVAKFCSADVHVAKVLVNFRYMFTVLFTGIKDDHGKFIKQELYGMKLYCQCYQRNFLLNVIVLLHHLHGAM